MDTVRQGQQCFNFDLPSAAVVNRVDKFESQFIANSNLLYCS